MVENEKTRNKQNLIFVKYLNQCVIIFWRLAEVWKCIIY